MPPVTFLPAHLERPLPQRGRRQRVAHDAPPGSRNGFQPVTLLLFLVASLLVSFFAFPSAGAQLAMSPGPTAATAAGTGALAYAGNNGAASAAALATPSALAYDAQGNLYVADTVNHAVRELEKSSGKLVTVAGTGTAGFAGDGGPATAALLDTPGGVAVSASGDLFIADSHNHRIRRVSAGVITTVAGTGTAGFGGDGGAATSASLSSPESVAVDLAGNLYIADTGNHRIRMVSGGAIRTVAGTGEQGYSGDGGPALLAALDSPSSVAVDSSSNLYIADRHNHRIRSVNGSGVIATVAGSGAPSFAGGFSGDGTAAAAGLLSRPFGVSVDPVGNLYIADTNNQRIRVVTSGVIYTAAGRGEQAFAGDGGALPAAVLDTPRFATVAPGGELTIADTGNERIRLAADASLSFDPTPVGLVSGTETVTLTNSGSGPLTLSSATFSGPFTFAGGGTCSGLPITLAPGASCTELISFTPGAVGPATGTVTFAGPTTPPEAINLSGTGSQASSTIALQAGIPAVFINQDASFTATVKSSSGAVPTGTVTFYANGTPLGAAVPLQNGTAVLSIAFATAGTYSITATYSGDGNDAGSSAASVAQLVGDFGVNVASTSGGSAAAVSVIPGNAATYNLAIVPVNGAFPFPVMLSATGLPPGSTAAFSPATLTPGGATAPFTMTVQTKSGVSALGNSAAEGGSTALSAFALLLLPFAGKLRRVARSCRPLLLAGLAVLSLGGLLAVSGCGAHSGFFGEQQNTYTIHVVGTSTDAQGFTLQRMATVQLTVQ